MSTTKLWRKLARSKKYREAFVASHLKRSIPFQIGAMRKKARLSQAQLAEVCELTQGVISRAENPNYGNLTFNTILRIAAGLDVAFVGEFVSFSDFVQRVEQLSEQSAQVATFKEEESALGRADSREIQKEDLSSIESSAALQAAPPKLIKVSAFDELSAADMASSVVQSAVISPAMVSLVAQGTVITPAAGRLALRGGALRLHVPRTPRPVQNCVPSASGQTGVVPRRPGILENLTQLAQ